MKTQVETAGDSFEQFGLSEGLMRAIADVGYEMPTPIQLKTIPLLLDGRDIIGQAQTGTGKTAAFALPILERLDRGKKTVQAVVLTPTRELAIQVAEAFHTYSKHLTGLRVLPIYGGQSIEQQFNRLRSGVHVIVGTPGRIMDHLRRETLDFSHLKFVVLDEADEMLRMGFIDDVEWILGHTSAEHQTALFSATIPREVRRIADRYLKNPAHVEIEHKTLTVPTIEQFYINVSDAQKADVLTRLLENDRDESGAVLIFDRTKIGAANLTEKLQARGYAAEAMHGDMSQSQREAVIRRLRGGQVEIVVATDVAARGLDVERITQVINYDMPNDPEVYVHRIGRTGRAGRTGTAVLFVTARQQRMKSEIERFTNQRIEPMRMPTKADVARRRIALFKERIHATLRDEDLDLYLTLVGELAEESGRDIAEIAAAAARLAGGDKPLEVVAAPEPEPRTASHVARPTSGENGMTRLFFDVGHHSQVRPADIVGAIANEANVPGRAIGAIDIQDHFTLVDVPSEYVEQILESMRGSRIRNHNTNIRLANARDASAPAEPVKRTAHKAGKIKKDDRKGFKKNAKSPRKKAG
ncbi:MAG: DEAD/DEAH box helicase [Pyrinomonadaceae bacterium MAG19_C2-C3]|nr:DEAD/DEAH box helicase [Pyrinomonadaceae bacterium MAG19_C2-C3]